MSIVNFEQVNAGWEKFNSYAPTLIKNIIPNNHLLDAMKISFPFNSAFFR